MRRVFFIIISIIIVILAIICNWFYNKIKDQRFVNRFNKEYEIYLNSEITGVDITTIINKAIDNNEKNMILKNKDGLYVEDDNNSIKVFIKVVQDGEFYPMEKINEIGMNKFIKAYSGALFKCTNKEYHSNNKLSKLNFEIQN